MEPLPKRTSLIHETAATLKEWIRSGVLKDVLPGELHLKTRLGVGRDTLRLALKLLTEEGWVTPASKGQQRRVQEGRAAPDQEAPTELLPVTFLSPHAIEHRVTLLELEDTRLRLAEQGRNLRFVAPDIFHLQNPDRQLERLVRAHPSTAWVLYLASEQIQRWFDRNGIPTLIYGSAFPGVKLPFVVSDWGAAAFHAGVQLIRQGHRTIGILEYHERFPGLIAEERGLEQALAPLGDQGRLLVFKDDRTPETVAASLERAFSLKERPTALVVTAAAQLLTCYSWLVSRGIRIPGDVSVVSLANDSWFAELHPPLCHYKPDSKMMSRNIAQRVLELVSSGLVTRDSIRVPMGYVPGSTIGPSPRAGK
jgi:DNA-binding LacI/PurR family transcriptional regulator